MRYTHFFRIVSIIGLCAAFIYYAFAQNSNFSDFFYNGIEGSSDPGGGDGTLSNQSGGASSNDFFTRFGALPESGIANQSGGPASQQSPSGNINRYYQPNALSQQSPSGNINRYYQPNALNQQASPQGNISGYYQPNALSQQASPQGNISGYYQPNALSQQASPQGNISGYYQPNALSQQPVPEGIIGYQPQALTNQQVPKNPIYPNALRMEPRPGSTIDNSIRPYALYNEPMPANGRLYHPNSNILTETSPLNLEGASRKPYPLQTEAVPSGGLRPGVLRVESVPGSLPPSLLRAERTPSDDDMLPNALGSESSPNGFAPHELRMERTPQSLSQKDTVMTARSMQPVETPHIPKKLSVEPVPNKLPQQVVAPHSDEDTIAQEKENTPSTLRMEPRPEDLLVSSEQKPSTIRMEPSPDKNIAKEESKPDIIRMVPEPQNLSALKKDDTTAEEEETPIVAEVADDVKTQTNIPANAPDKRPSDFPEAIPKSRVKRAGRTPETAPQSSLTVSVWTMTPTDNKYPNSEHGESYERTVQTNNQPKNNTNIDVVSEEPVEPQSEDAGIASTQSHNQPLIRSVEPGISNNGAENETPASVKTMLDSGAFIQLASYTKEAQAKNAVKSTNAGVSGKRLFVYKPPSSNYYKLVVGPFGKDDVGVQLLKVNRAGFSDAFIIRSN